LLLSLTGTLCAIASAATHVVYPDGSGDFPTIEAAMIAAAEGDTVALADGIFTGDGNRDIDYAGRSITLCSQNGDPQNCVIDCQGSEEDPHRGFLFISGEGPESALRGVTITNGFADGFCCEDLTGGAIRCQFQSSPTITNCVFSGNSAVTDGGAILCSDYSSPLIMDCLFTGNSAPLGGAIASGGFASPTIINCTFFGNQAAPAPSNGGAMNIRMLSSPTISDCTFYGNSAETGSGIYCYFSSEPVITNTIIAFGIQGEGFYSFDSTPTLACCDIYGNAGGDWTGYIADQYGTDGNISVDPLFCDAGSGDLGLHANSPCLPWYNPECGLIGAWAEGCPSTGVGDDSILEDIRLRANPNPFSSGTRISYSVPRQSSAPVLLRIFDPTGRLVRTLVDAAQPAGTYSVAWNGTDLTGQMATGGIYFCRLSVGEETQTNRMILLK
jgi:predicted outer membrane repeat protein